MSSTVFDTLAYSKRLKAAGVPEAQAEAQAEALADAITGQIATKTDVNETKLELKAEIAAVKSDVALLKWMVGFNLALSVTILFKIFT